MKKFVTAVGVIFGLTLLLALGVSVTVASPATYCVRKTGNDGDTGACPGNAWLTVDHAANQVVAGDIVYIGSGIYRELVTMDTSGTVTDTIHFIGDIDGVQTGDPGPVILSAFDSETGDAQRSYCLDMDEQTFIVWQYVIFDGGEIACAGDTDGVADIAYEGFEFRSCVFLAGDDNLDRAIYLEINDGVTPATNGLQIKKCVVTGEFQVEYDTQSTSHKNLKWDIRNSLFLTHYSTQNGFSLHATGTLTRTIGGIQISNSTFWGHDSAVFFDDLENTTNTCDVYNSHFIGCNYGIYASSCAANTINEDYNFGTATSSLSIGTGIISGGNSDNTTSGPLLGGIADLMFYNKLGWSPWRPWEPMSLRDDSYEAPIIDAGYAGHAPSKDIYAEVRPMKRNTDDIGAVEARARGEKEDTTFHGGALSLRFDGAGYHDAIIPVPAQAMTVTVYARYDANHTGSLPQLKAYAIPGVADQTDTMVAAVNTWEQLEVNFTPTSAGYAVIRFVSRDTSANGQCFFDDAAY